MAETGVDEAVLVTSSGRAQLPVLGFLGLLLCVYVFLGVAGVIASWLAIACVVIFAVVFVVAAVAVLKARKSSWELRLDQVGVTVRGQGTVPWSDVAEVRVAGLAPGRFFWFPVGYQVLAFVGRPGVELAPLPSTKARRRLYGTRLVVIPRTMDTSTELITGSVRRWSEVPIRERATRRGAG